MKYTFDAPLLNDTTSTLMWNFIVQVPHKYSHKLDKPNRRILCSINGENPFHCALTPDGTGSYNIIINKEKRKKLKLEVGDALTITIEKDNSEYGMAVPEAFIELCSQDPEGKTVFHQLTPGKQRSLLHIMGKPKSEQKQLEKTLIIFDYLKSVNGNLDFKELNEAFKSNRFKR